VLWGSLRLGSGISVEWLVQADTVVVKGKVMAPQVGRLQ